MITAPSVQQFMLRKERHKKMIKQGLYPSSTNTQFIVPCFQRSFGFRTNQYHKNKEVLQNYIDEASFDDFVKSANRIIDKQLMQKADNQNSPFFSVTIALGILTFTILSLIVYLDFLPAQEQIILNTSIVLIITSVAIASICPFYLYLRKYTQYDYEAIIKQQLDKLAENQNNRNKQQGREHLEWVFQKSFFWIQLKIGNSAVNAVKSKTRKFLHNQTESKKSKQFQIQHAQ